jgi:integrase
MKGSRALTDDEVERVKAAFTGTFFLRDRALFILGVKAGFRISELLSLTVGDIFQNGKFVDKITVARRHMKKKREGRTVALHPEALQALKDWYVGGGGPFNSSVFIFISRKGANRALSRISAWKVLRKAFEKCGLTGKLGTHCMRKTFAKKVHEKLGRDLLKTQKALGHASVNSTVSYLSVDEEEIDDAILKA